ncbi:MAG TPA: cupin domain-containing protein [Halococcus sp.]|nr:cupin domain-containing protein [Halococcus sp.]
MGYRVLDTEGVEPSDDRPCTLRRLAEPAGLEHVAINRFRAEPGEMLPLSYHYHDEQEEAFFVLSGTLSVETPDEVYEIEENELFSVDPGSPQRAFNPESATSAVCVLAIGAPPVSGDVHAYEP